MTVAAGFIASRYGAVVGGLFLAFPAIFPASATLIEKHVRERQEKAGASGTRRGKKAAALDATGAVLGSFGLAAFAFVIWLVIESSPVLALVRRPLRGSPSPCRVARSALVAKNGPLPWVIRRQDELAFVHCTRKL